MAFGPPGHRPGWQKHHRDETRVPGLLAACISTGFISVVIMALRFYSRWLQHGRIHLESSDWFALVAWIFFVMVDSAWAVGTKHGVGRHAVVVDDFHKVQILAVVSEATYIIALMFTKLSILAAYLKTFPIRKFRYWVWGVSASVVSWGMAGAIVAILQCTSIDFVWISKDQGFCMDFTLRNFIFGIINAVINIVIVAIVATPASNLPIARQKRWMVQVCFLVGISACLVSILRLPFSVLVGRNDRTWDVVPTGIIGMVEITIGLLAVSIPTYRPLYEHIFGGERERSDKRTSHPLKFMETLHMGIYGQGPRNDVNVTSHGTHMGCDHAGINVTNHIELVRHANRCGNWVRVTDEDEEELCKHGRRDREGEP
ncbi:hypothetical protein F4777DRAFT_526933 [Nemania sp. FL0916]|nr:hypothetical protein F4777DRAFT_526933 [Nemania sp. FL0916]